MSVRILIDTLGRHYTSRAKDRPCEQCGSMVRHRRGIVKFCSRLCFYASRRGTFPNRRQMVRTGQVLSCAECGLTFYRKPSAIQATNNYCSRSCNGLANVEKFEHRQRSNPTSLERLLYGALAELGQRFQPQRRFGRMIVDAYLPDCRTAVEVDGEYWHSRPENIERDRRKEQFLKGEGIRLVRISERQAKGAIGAILRGALCQ